MISPALCLFVALLILCKPLFASEQYNMLISILLWVVGMQAVAMLVGDAVVIALVMMSLVILMHAYAMRMQDMAPILPMPVPRRRPAVIPGG